MALGTPIGRSVSVNNKRYVGKKHVYAYPISFIDFLSYLKQFVKEPFTVLAVNGSFSLITISDIKK
ncbi:hypothetical protein IV75_GL000018 [Carnobacterium maltaromaticum]|nr:hypothetical protein IV75_GL000018 [Carnobacterium maltaromaticum]